MAGDAGESLLRNHALEIFRAGLAAADPGKAVLSALAFPGRLRVAARDAPAGLRRVRAIAFGKAACAMAAAAEEVLPRELFPGPGVAVTSRGSVRALSRFRVIEAGHPLPDPAGVEGARAVAQALQGSAREELALVLISGGGSALLPAPAPGISLADKVETTGLLLAAGADIRELNTVRKHLSTLKGGGLARAAAPAWVRALILSDVIGDDRSVIASGPVSPDPSTFADALAVLARRDVLRRAPRPVVRRLEAGARGELPETPKPGDPLFERVECEIVGSNRQSVAASRTKAEGLGYVALALPDPVMGEARAAARRLADVARDCAARGGGTAQARVAGGETTVTVSGGGRGGRNQELALALALELEPGLPGWDWCFLSAGTDGVDGPTDAAGGLVDAFTLARIRARGIDPRAALEANDSYTALDAALALVRTGPTGTNVADLQTFLLRRR